MEKQPIKARLIIESQGTGEEVVAKSLQRHIEMMKQISGGTIGDIKEQKPEKSEATQGLWSGLLDVGVTANDFEGLMAYILGAGPTNIIILEPKKLEITSRELQNVVNDFAHLIHGLAKLNVKMKIDNYILSKLIDEIKAGKNVEFHDEAQTEAGRAAKTLEGEPKPKLKVVK